MRTCETDYTNTVIYKISCKDPSVTDLYVGHTTDFVKRLKSHRHACGDLTAQNKLYTFIREHGGWQNWKMEMVYFFGCNGLSEAREKEQEYFVSLGATLNSIEPYPNSETKEEAPRTTVDNVTVVNDNIGSYKFFCEKCNYACNKNSDINKHNLTQKHLNLVKPIKEVSNKSSACNRCNKEYIARNSLWYHKQKCKQIKPTDNSNDISSLLDDNKILCNFIREQHRAMMEQQHENLKLINNVIQANLISK